MREPDFVYDASLGDVKRKISWWISPPRKRTIMLYDHNHHITRYIPEPKPVVVYFPWTAWGIGLRIFRYKQEHLIHRHGGYVRDQNGDTVKLQRPIWRETHNTQPLVFISENGPITDRTALQVIALPHCSPNGIICMAAPADHDDIETKFLSSPFKLGHVHKEFNAQRPILGALALPGNSLASISKTWVKTGVWLPDAHCINSEMNILRGRMK